MRMNPARAVGGELPEPLQVRGGAPGSSAGGAPRARSVQPKEVMSDRDTCGEQAEQRQQAALVIALRTGLLKKCPAHGEVYDPGQHDYQGACMVAAFLVNRDDPLVATFAGDRAPLTELLKSICAPYALRCSRCPVNGAV
jgi:hypothetical protein